MNPLVAALAAMALPHVRELGDKYLEKLLQLILGAVTGTVSDEALLDFLRERAKGQAKP